MFYFKIDYYLIFFINSRLDHLGGAGTFSFLHSNYTGADRVGERPTTNRTHHLRPANQRTSEPATEKTTASEEKKLQKQKNQKKSRIEYR